MYEELRVFLRIYYLAPSGALCFARIVCKLSVVCLAVGSSLLLCAIFRTSCFRFDYQWLCMICTREKFFKKLVLTKIMRL